MPTPTVSPTLEWNVLVTNREGLVHDLPPGKEQWTWVPTSATLIFGQRDAVLVDAFLTIEQTAALVEWVSARRQEPDHDLCHSRPWGPFFWHRSASESLS